MFGSLWLRTAAVFLLTFLRQHKAACNSQPQKLETTLAAWLEKPHSLDLLASVPEPMPVTTFIRIWCQRGKSQLSVMDYQPTFHLTIFSPGAELARKDLFKYVSSRIKALLNLEQVFCLQSFPDRIFFSSMHYLVGVSSPTSNWAAGSIARCWIPGICCCPKTVKHILWFILTLSFWKTHCSTKWGLFHSCGYSLSYSTDPKTVLGYIKK